MTSLVEAKMGDSRKQKNHEVNPRRPMVWIALAALVTIFMSGALHGVINVSLKKGTLLSISNIAIIATIFIIIIGLIYAQWHWIKLIRDGDEPLNSRETLNRNLLFLLTLLGTLTSTFIVFLSSGESKNPLFDILFIYNKPISIQIAIIFVAMWAVITPIVTWIWYNRAIDEQESAAYRDGAIYAGHAYLFIAPTWWILWRAEILPEPNGVIIFIAFSFIWSIVWLWKKYF